MDKVVDLSKGRLRISSRSLLDVQIQSYQRFLDKGIGEILEKIFPIDTKNILA